MSYKLEKPYTEQQRNDFVVEYNHNKGLAIKETEQALYALEMWEVLEGDKVIENKEHYEQEQKLKKRECLDKLNVTRGDVFEALILARQITKVQIREMIIQNIVDQMQQALMLNRFDEALNYYRGYPIFDMLGAIVGITSEQWDNYFIKATNEETKADAYKELLPPEGVKDDREEEVVDG